MPLKYTRTLADLTPPLLAPELQSHWKLDEMNCTAANLIYNLHSLKPELGRGREAVHGED